GGTPMYMAPEQALGQPLDQRADLFSLGSVLYQMVAGRPPFWATTVVAVLKRVAEDTPRAIREIIPEAPQWLCDIIAKLHAKDPDDRYQSAREVADVLGDCETQLRANAKLKDYSRIPRSKYPAVAKSGRWKWAAAAARLPVTRTIDIGRKVFDIELSKDGKSLAVGSGHSYGILHELDRSEVVEFKGHGNAVTRMAISPDNSLVATGSDDKTIRLWKVPDTKQVIAFQDHAAATTG